MKHILIHSSLNPINYTIPKNIFRHKLKDIEWIESNLILGNSELKCNGIGICKITAKGSIQPHTCKGCVVPALLSKVNSNTLQLVIEKTAVSNKQKSKHFSKRHVRLTNSFVLPKSICKQMKIKQTVEVLPKVYTLFQNEDHYFYYINFNKI